MATRSLRNVGRRKLQAGLLRSIANDFISKLKTVEEEIDESEFWLDLVVELGLGKASKPPDCATSREEIRAMTTASLKTARSRQGSQILHRQVHGKSILRYWADAQRPDSTTAN